MLIPLEKHISAETTAINHLNLPPRSSSTVAHHGKRRIVGLNKRTELSKNAAI